MHGKSIVDKLKSEKEINEFIIVWRKFFVENLTP